MSVPKIIDVKPINNMNLIVYFDGGIAKRYDIKKLFDKFPAFKDLEKNGKFKLVKPEVGGVAIVWNKDIDLSRYEIWENGKDV